jgi:hypothetical protein
VLVGVKGDASIFGTIGAKGPLSFKKESQLWRERYRVLFGENIAGVSLTTPKGRIVDCNEACARWLLVV